MPSSSSNGNGAGSSSSKKNKSRSSNGSGSGGKSQSQLSSIEKKVWQAIQKQEGQTISNEKIQTLFPHIEVNELGIVINTLLRKSLLNAQQDHNGSLHFVAFSKSEASTMGNLESDESVIFSHIRVAGNEGIWTKQLKVRTNLHQTVMARGLKSLESKGLIKAVKSVKFPTRKIYMLATLTPSVELSGGPWYTDNELDTAFIDQLCTILFQFIAAKTWPGKRLEESRDFSKRPLFPASHLSSLPTAASCLSFLKKSNITDTDLQVENVQNLLDVLVYDGKIEKIPHVRMGRDDEDDDWTPNGKRAGYEDESSEGSVVGSTDDESESEEESDDDESERDSRKRKGRKSDKGKKSKSKKTKSRYRDEEDEKRRKEKQKRKNNSYSKSISLAGSESEVSESEEEVESEMEIGGGSSTVFVYRAVRQIHIETGWIETPCAHCPVFDFCAPGGPVNAEGCVYMRDWIKNCATMRAKELSQEGYNGEGEQDVKLNGGNGIHHGANGQIGYEENMEEEDADDYDRDVSKINQEEEDDDPYGGEEL